MFEDFLELLLRDLGSAVYDIDEARSISDLPLVPSAKACLLGLGDIEILSACGCTFISSQCSLRGELLLIVSLFVVL